MKRTADDHLTTDEDAELRVEVDEYLWPLTGAASPIDWQLLTEELHIRERLGEIMTHVRETHVAPRIRRVHGSSAARLTKAIIESIIAGPADGPPWDQVLHAPVPRALRVEWTELAQRLREIETRRQPRSPLDD